MDQKSLVEHMPMNILNICYISLYIYYVYTLHNLKHRSRHSLELTIDFQGSDISDTLDGQNPELVDIVKVQ